MEWLYTNGYRTLTLDELLNGEVRDKCVVLTFDDGHLEMFEVVAPILSKRGISATFFLNTGFLDNKDMFFRHKASLLIGHLKSLQNGKYLKLVEKNLKENS